MAQRVPPADEAPRKTPKDAAIAERTARMSSTKTYAVRGRIAKFIPRPVVAMAALATLSFSWTALGAGLDTRPDNTTCVAFDRPLPAGSVDVATEDILSTGGIPLNWIPSTIPGEDEVFFLGERLGRILRYDLGSGGSSVVIDMTSFIKATDASGRGEGGLLGMALHPAFAESGAVGEGELYLHYTSPGNPMNTTIARVTSTNGGLSFSTGSLEVLFEFQQENEFHNGGGLFFGLDGYLYAAFGDGGHPPDDPVTQDTTNPFGAIIRIDVDNADTGAGTPYSIPETNPFFGDTSGNLPETFAWGFRQPYRGSVDQLTGEIWVGDVGKSTWEEVDRVVNGGNYGWPIREGAHCFEGNPCSPVGLIDPVAEFNHSEGNAIAGGYVYRGNDIPGLQGVYIYGDFGTGKIWGLFTDSEGNFVVDLLTQLSGRIFGFGQGLDGEIYILQQGDVLKLIPGSGSNPTPFPQLLSETGCVDPNDPTQMSDALIPFDVSSKLYSDDALKDRWLGLPNGTTVDILSDGDFDFPIGTVLVKNFQIDGQLIETRLFMRHDDGGWAGYSYAWDEGENDASLLVGLLERELDSQIWTYPSREQCLQCHTSAANFSLGPELGQLNHPFTYPASGESENQLTVWDQIGVLADPLPAPIEDLVAYPDPSDSSQNLDQRARAYLHSNCAGCHRPGTGVPTAFDVRFDVPFESTGLCNADPTEGDLGVPGAKLLVPGNPGLSLLSIRQHRTTTGVMPPVGRSLVDPVGTSVIDAWITSVLADCSGPDTDGDQVPDAEDNCPDVSNPGQEDSNGNGIGDACDGPPPVLPDYSLTDVRGPANVTIGDLVSLEADALNQGTADGPGPALEVAFYLSEDPVIDPAADTLVGGCMRADLGVSEAGTCAADLTVPSVPTDPNPSTYYWGACADDPDTTTEISETNNCAPGDTVLVPEPMRILAQGFALLTVIAVVWLRRRALESA